MIIQNVDIRGQNLDIRITDNRISEIGSLLKGNQYFNGLDGALIPGLHDHHIHLSSAAAALNSVQCGPPKIKNEEDLIHVLSDNGQGWIRGIGYHQSVAGDIDRYWLDRYGSKRPIRIQHRSGRLWMLNSLALEMLNLDESCDGRLYDQDFLLRASSDLPDLQSLIHRLLSWGITGVTEVTPSNGSKEFHYYKKNAKPLKLSIMGRAELARIDDSDVGPLKLHYHDHDLPPLKLLIEEIKLAHDSGRAVAVHCVTRAEIMLTLAAIETAGIHPGDRIEHAAIADEYTIEWMNRLGVTIVTQPNFIAERVDAYLKDVPELDHVNLWRLKSFHEAGLKLAAGSDAPFGNPNPWLVMAAAVSRPEKFRSENVSAEIALGLYTKPAETAGGKPRQVKIGQVADLCLLDRPWREARKNLADVKVKATWIDGDLVYNGVD